MRGGSVELFREEYTTARTPEHTTVNTTVLHVHCKVLGRGT